MKIAVSTLLASLITCTSALAVTPLDGLPKSVSDLHKAITAEECQFDIEIAPESYDLGQGNQLFLVPCFMGAYQGSSRVYSYKVTSKEAKPLTVLDYNEETKRVSRTMDLSEATFDPKTNVLSTFAKARGPADCGQSSESKILVTSSGITAKTIEIRHKAECDGEYGKWPVVFSQK